MAGCEPQSSPQPGVRINSTHSPFTAASSSDQAYVVQICVVVQERIFAAYRLHYLPGTVHCSESEIKLLLHTLLHADEWSDSVGFVWAAGGNLTCPPIPKTALTNAVVVANHRTHGSWWPYASVASTCSCTATRLSTWHMQPHLNEAYMLHV